MWGMAISSAGVVCNLVGALLLIWEVGSRDWKGWRPQPDVDAEDMRFAERLAAMQPELVTPRSQLRFARFFVGLRQEARQRLLLRRESHRALWGAALMIGGVGLQLVGMWGPILLAPYFGG